jgi:sporulation related protein
MSMADDHTFRSLRSNDPNRRAEPARSSDLSGASDPLAELARLIGQSDPLADLGRAPRPASSASYQRDDYPAQAPRDWPPREQHYAADDRRSSGREVYQAREDYPPAPQLHGDDRYRDDRRYEERHDDRRYDDGRYDEGHYDERRVDSDPNAQHYAAYGEQSADHGQQHYAGQQGDDQSAHDEHAGEAYYHEDVPLPPHEDEMYDDAPRRRNHSGLATALALIGCAMLGTAGAYAYRSYYPGSVQPPPVITADTSTPTKIVPAAGDPQSGKAVQDRLANAGKEQIVTKQEEPVALSLGTSAAPRVVLPAPVAPAQAAPVPAAGPAAAAPRAAAPPGTSFDAKSVRTERIRPDGTDTSGRPIGLPPTAQPPATRPAAAPAPSGGGTGPLSLQPQSSEAPPAAPAPRRTAAIPPPSRPADATTTATAGHVVQLSSQKSEGEAQSVFRSLQAKFPSELGDRKPIIARADLGGSKGVVYRTQVGPFASAAEASRWCTSYKSAGGQCFVP